MIGLIGCGNMAHAMIHGMVTSGLVKAEEILVSNRSVAKLEAVREELGVYTMQDNCEVARRSDVLILAVKPQFYAQVMDEIKQDLKPEVLFVSIAPGWTLQRMEQQLGFAAAIVRTMPNTPAMVGEGMTALCPNQRVSQAQLQQLQQLFSSFGRTTVVPEHLMDAIPAVSGSSPAYVFMFIEAMADAAVMDGIPRAQAYQLAAQAVLGSARMVLETGLHPGALKDMVCSPAGTTIQAVRVLEEKGMRSAVIEAMQACTQKCKSM